MMVMDLFTISDIKAEATVSKSNERNNQSIHFISFK